MSVPLLPNLPDKEPRSMEREPRRLLPAVALILLLIQAFLPLAGCASPGALPEATSTAAPTAVPSATAEPLPPTITPVAQEEPESRPEATATPADGRQPEPTPMVVGDPEADSQAVNPVPEGQGEQQPEQQPPADESRSISIALGNAEEGTPPPEVSLPASGEPVYPLAVMVENLVDARPQSGLARADIVYEALVEGNITRFMAIYLNGSSDVIGPVRSARHYFVYLAAEFNASYVHIGASPQGYAALKATGLTRLDETYGDPGFWRSRTRFAPHNAYTSTDLIRSSLERVRHATPGSLAGFRFLQETESAQGPESREIELVYPGGYRVRYVYSREDKQYRRYMDGLPHKDSNTGEQVSPSNVVVQFVNAWRIPGDDAGRLDMEQVGEGRALYFHDGIVREGFWHKPSYGNYTEWYDADGKTVTMDPGRTWVQVIAPSGRVSY